MMDEDKALYFYGLKARWIEYIGEFILVFGVIMAFIFTIPVLTILSFVIGIPIILAAKAMQFKFKRQSGVILYNGSGGYR